MRATAAAAYMLIMSVWISGCTELPDLVFDNPIDPENTSAPLSRPVSAQATYMNDSLIKFFWNDVNYSTQGYVVERKRVGQQHFTVVVRGEASAFELIEAAPGWIFVTFNDTMVRRADAAYVYRVKAYNFRNGLTLESPYSSEYTVSFP
jgi:hypothetical protein